MATERPLLDEAVRLIRQAKAIENPNVAAQHIKTAEVALREAKRALRQEGNKALSFTY